MISIMLALGGFSLWTLILIYSYDIDNLSQQMINNQWLIQIPNGSLKYPFFIAGMLGLIFNLYLEHLKVKIELINGFHILTIKDGHLQKYQSQASKGLEAIYLRF